MEDIRQEALELYRKLKEELGKKPSSTIFYKKFSKRKLSKAFEGGNTWSKLQILAGDKPTRFSSEKSDMNQILIDWGFLARKTLTEYNKLPIQSDWAINKLRPTVNGIEQSHKIRWSEIPSLFYKRFNNESDWKDICCHLSNELQNEITLNKKTEEYCYVYLMLDLRNKAYKIGISKNPKIREKTLQSEQPKIKIIAAKKYINRKIAGAIEKALHETYSHKRKRGEWFFLDEEDLKELIYTLKSK
ncbi:GIY-YIG nuclease family protein [Aquimarina rhabdastrellae]